MMNMNNLAQTHEILTPQLATKVGLTKFEFYKYVKANEYEQVGHGVYAAKDTWIDELEMLHRRCPMGVFSHDEAFYYYGLTDREPLVHTLTIYSGYNVHRLKEDGYKVLDTPRSETSRNSHFRRKQKIRTLLLSRKGSDFHGLVRVVIQHFLKTIVVQFVFEVIG